MSYPWWCRRANHALQAVGVAAATEHLPSRPIVVCGIGNGAARTGEFLEAVADDARTTAGAVSGRRQPVRHLDRPPKVAPLLTARRTRHEYLGERIQPRIDGRDVVQAHEQLGAIGPMRNQHRGPRWLCSKSNDSPVTQTPTNRPCIAVPTCDVSEPRERAIHSPERSLDSGVPADQLLEIQRAAASEVESAERAASDGPSQPSEPSETSHPRSHHACGQRAWGQRIRRAIDDARGVARCLGTSFGRRSASRLDWRRHRRSQGGRVRRHSRPQHQVPPVAYGTRRCRNRRLWASRLVGRWRASGRWRSFNSPTSCRPPTIRLCASWRAFASEPTIAIRRR